MLSKAQVRFTSNPWDLFALGTKYFQPTRFTKVEQIGQVIETDMRLDIYRYIHIYIYVYIYIYIYHPCTGKVP